MSTITQEVAEQIEALYLKDLIEGSVECTNTVSFTPKGTITTQQTRRRASTRDRLEFLRIAMPEKWNPPPPLQPLQFHYKTIDAGLDDLQKLITAIDVPVDPPQDTTAVS